MKKDSKAVNAFKTKVGSKVHQKLLVTIMRIQSELIRSYDLDVDHDIIKITEDELIWCLVGHSASYFQIIRFGDIESSHKIRDFAIDKIYNSRILHGSELITLDISPSKYNPTSIIVRSKIFPISVKRKLWDKFLYPFKKIWDLIIKAF